VDFFFRIPEADSPLGNCTSTVFVSAHSSGTREIPYSAIRTVEIKNVQTEKGDSLACVSLVLKDDSEVALTQFRQGSLALYHALQKSLDKYSATGVR